MQASAQLQRGTLIVAVVAISIPVCPTGITTSFIEDSPAKTNLIAHVLEAISRWIDSIIRHPDAFHCHL